MSNVRLAFATLNFTSDILFLGDICHICSKKLRNYYKRPSPIPENILFHISCPLQTNANRLNITATWAACFLAIYYRALAFWFDLRFVDFIIRYRFFGIHRSRGLRLFFSFIHILGALAFSHAHINESNIARVLCTTYSLYAHLLSFLVASKLECVCVLNLVRVRAMPRDDFFAVVPVWFVRVLFLFRTNQNLSFSPATFPLYYRSNCHYIIWYKVQHKILPLLAYNDFLTLKTWNMCKLNDDRSVYYLYLIHSIFRRHWFNTPR